MSESMSLRARKKLQVRDLLENTALRMFDERGYQATTVEDITAAVQFSERTFFRHFRSKEDVVFANHTDNLHRLRRALDQQPATATATATATASATASASATESVMKAVRHAILNLQDFEHRRELELARVRIVQATPALADRVYALQAEYEAVIASAIARSLGDDPDAWIKAVLLAGAAVAVMALRADAQVAAAPDDQSPTHAMHRAFDLLEQAAHSLLHPPAP
jgi:AcrR family transcriptional regulator